MKMLPKKWSGAHLVARASTRRRSDYMSNREGYVGVIKAPELPLRHRERWTCKHFHRSQSTARSCARKALREYEAGR